MWKRFQFNAENVHFSCEKTTLTSILTNRFDVLLRSEWNRAVDQGLFACPIDSNSEKRILDDGDLNYTLSLNAKRFETRRTPYPFHHVKTPFDRTKFNFNKIKDAEILFSLDTDANLIVINNAPIGPFHVLLVPRRELEQAQIITIDSLIFAFRFVTSSAHPFIYIGFNSLCGYASMNHLHFHSVYLPGPSYLQKTTCPIFHEKRQCFILDLFETKAFAFEIRSIDDFERVARLAHIVTNYFTESNIAHNFSLVKGKSFYSSNIDALRLFIWFRQSIPEAKLFERCNFACMELGGLMTLENENVFRELTENECRQHLNEIALPINDQEQIRRDLTNLFDIDEEKSIDIAF